MEIIEPYEIEKRSFEIIDSRRNFSKIPEQERDIVKRVIHTTADFDYFENLKFSKNAVEAALEALKNGCNIVTDTKMAYAGINKTALSTLSCKINCFISDEDVAKKAKERHITRSAVAMEKAAELGNNTIFAIGNAPTALITLCDLINKQKITPKLIIGVPVGFVNVIYSKSLVQNLNIPYIVSIGNKGGSTVAAAIINGLIYKLIKR